MSILDNIEKKSRVDVRSVIPEEPDESDIFEFVSDKSVSDFVKEQNDFRTWLTFAGRNEDVYNNAFDVQRVLKNYLLEIPTVKNWSRVYIVGPMGELVVGFNPDVRTARSGIRLILSILSMIHCERVATAGIIRFFLLGHSGEAYYITFNTNYINEFDKMDPRISGLRDFLGALCNRYNDITEREFKKAVAQTSRVIYRMRQKMQCVNIY